MLVRELIVLLQDHNPNAEVTFDDVALTELLLVIKELSRFLHPGTSHAEPGDEEALVHAEEVLQRYRPAV